MTSTFFADTNTKIRKLKEDRNYPVQNKSGLSLIKRGNSKYFVGAIRFPFNKDGNKIMEYRWEECPTEDYIWEGYGFE